MKTKLFLFFSVAIFTSYSNVWSQTNRTFVLVNSIQTEFHEIVEKSENNLKKQFTAAQIYLQAVLKQLEITDTSTLFEEKYIELEVLAEKENSKKRKTASEELYLYLSILKPYQSDSLFNLLLKSYMHYPDQDFPVPASISVVYYKLWLYQLLDDRFKSETESFNKNLKIVPYNQLQFLLLSPFTSISGEQQLIEKLIQLSKIHAQEIGIKAPLDTTLLNIYEIRIYHIYMAPPTDNLNERFNLIESLYTQALTISTNSQSLNDNMGIYYYNEAMRLLEIAKTETDPTKTKERALEFFEKGKKLLNLE